MPNKTSVTSIHFIPLLPGLSFVNVIEIVCSTIPPLKIFNGDAATVDCASVIGARVDNVIPFVSVTWTSCAGDEPLTVAVISDGCVGPTRATKMLLILRPDSRRDRSKTETSHSTVAV